MRHAPRASSSRTRVPSARRYVGRCSSATPAASQAARADRGIGEALDDGEQRAVLQERQLAGAEVVEQGTERLGAHRHLRVQLPGAFEIDRRHGGRSVDAAHAVDRDLLDEGVGLDHVVDVTVRFDEFVHFGLMGCSSVQIATHWRYLVMRTIANGTQCRLGRGCGDGRSSMRPPSGPASGRHAVDDARRAEPRRAAALHGSRVRRDDRRRHRRARPASGGARFFRYFASKNDLPWGEFDELLEHMRAHLAAMPDDVPLMEQLRRAIIEFNRFPTGVGVPPRPHGTAPARADARWRTRRCATRRGVRSSPSTSHAGSACPRTTSIPRRWRGPASACASPPTSSGSRHDDAEAPRPARRGLPAHRRAHRQQTSARAHRGPLDG